MNQFIFKSRWIAISFAVLMLFSAYMLVGDGDDGSVLGQLQDTAQDGDDSQAQLAASGTGEAPPPPAVDQSTDQSMDAEFVDDGELIDTAEGTDPSAGSDGEDDYGDGGDGPQFAPDGVEVIDGDSGDSGE